MIVSIKRLYKNSGLEAEVLFNTDYMIRIEPTGDWEENPPTRILMDSCSPNGPDIVYTCETVQRIKAKIRLQKKRAKKR